MKVSETFCKEERLYLKRDFGSIFKESNYFIIKPLKIYWKEAPSSGTKYPVKFGVSVPKKNVAKATDRNKIKRQIRDIYRKNKLILYNNSIGKNVLLILAIYTGPAKSSYSKIKESLILGLKKIQVRND